MKKTYSWLFSLLAFLFFSAISYAGTYQRGKFRLETTSSNGNVNIYHNDVRIINDSKSAFTINTRTGTNISTVSGTQRTVSSITSESSEAISDNFGSGIKVTLVYGSSASGVTATQYFYLYDDLDYLLTEMTLSSESDLLSNYIAPIKTTSGNTTALPGASSGNVNRVLEVPFHNDGFVRYGSQNFATTAITSTRNSYEAGGVYHEASRKGLIVGSVEHTTWKTGIIIGTRSRNNIYTMEVYGGRAQTLNSSYTSTQIHSPVKGKTIKSPKIFVGYFDDWRTGMETFGDVNAIVAPKYEWHGQKPFGWSSWGQIKDALDYYNLMGSAQWIHDNIQDPNNDNEPQANEFQNEGKTLISLDSYWDWQMNYNHWRTIPAILAKNNQRAGMYGGAYVHWSTDGTQSVGNTGFTYNDIYLRYNGNPQTYDGARALDPTHPGTKAIVENQLNNFLMWGYKYIKLDFVGHAALEADSWHDTNVTTGIQAYNYAMNHITTYLKNHPLYPKDEEVFLNLSIAPLFPANYAHSRRISCDAWGEFGSASGGGTTRYMLNSLTYGWWLDRVYSYNDADHASLLGRQSGDANSSSSATLNENRSRITSSAITGIFLLGDNYSSASDYPAGHPSGNVKVGNQTSKDRTPGLTTNAEVNEMVRRTKSFRPVYSGSAGSDNAEQYTTKIGDITYVAVFNNSNSSSNKTMNFADLGLSGNHTVHELWGDTKNTRSGNWSESVAARDVKLFKIYLEGHSGELPSIEQKTMPTYHPQPGQVTNAIATTHTSTAPAPNWKVIKDWTNGLPWTTGGRLIWGDYNNDGYLDALLFANEIKLYKNNGDDTFSEMPGLQVLNLKNGSAIFVDYNNDGCLDLITTGNQDNKGLDNRAYIFAYKNTGYPDYTFEMDVVNSANLIPGNTENGDGVGRMFEAVDFDHDGWMDLIHTGHPSDGGATNDGAWRITTLYRNNQGTFQRDRTAVNGVDFDRLAAGSIHVGDVNGDGYADIVSVGYGDDVPGGYAGRMYVNNGDGTFTKSTYSTSLGGNEQCETIFADIDGDGYDDIVEISGGYANLHINEKNGSFTKYLPAQTGLIVSGGTSITAGDVNNDGKLDLFVCGHGSGISTIYYNTGSNAFTPVDLPDGLKARSGSSNLVDINRDGNLDFSTYGYGTGWSSNFVLNNLGNGIPQNTAPAIPQNFTVSYGAGKYTLTWTISTDDITPQSALRYNVYAKEKSTGKTYFYAPADMITGKLKIGGGIVPLIKQNSFDWNLPESEYIFGVQAVDQADLSSRFAVKGADKASWTGAAGTNWHDLNNWEPAIIPDNTVDVYILGDASSYPYLTGNIIDNVCKDIFFLSGAELGRPDLLTYEKAHVQLNFGSETQEKSENIEEHLKFSAQHSNPIDRNRWYMLSIPLQDVVHGDLGFGGFPSVYLRKFDASKPNDATWMKGNWSDYQYMNNIPFSAAEGFIFWMNRFDEGIPKFMESGTGLEYGSVSGEDFGLAKVNGIVELPFFENEAMSDAHRLHSYNSGTETSSFKYHNGDLTLSTDEDAGLSRSNAYRFIFESDPGSPNVTYPIQFSADNAMALVGNPYISTIDFEGLLTNTANKANMKNAYQIWTGTGFAAYTGSGYAGAISGTSIDEFIAPMQSFIIEKTDVGASTFNLTFEIDNISVANPTNLRSSENKIDKLDIIATNDYGSVIAFIANREGGSNTFGNKDSRKLLLGISRTPEIYTLKEYDSDMIAVGANVIQTNSLLVPIGLATSSAGNMKLTFNGMNDYNATITFIDRIENKEINITGMSTYEYSFDYTPNKNDKGDVIPEEDRFFILFAPSDMTQLDDNAMDQIMVWNRGNVIHALSSSSNMIKQVSVYNAQGQLVYEDDNINNTSCSITGLKNIPEVLIVKLVTEKGVKSIKLLFDN